MFNKTNEEYGLNMLGFQRIQYLLDKLKSPLSLTSSALHPYSLATALNDMSINNRRNILEFGAGVSTVLFAKYFALFDLPGKIYSVEEDEQWMAFLQEKLAKEHLSDYVDFFHAPVSKTGKQDEDWYDTEFIKELTKAKVKIDLLLIDGPQAWRPKDFAIRKNVAPSVFELMAENSSIYLDDTNRKGEAKAVEEWSTKYNLNFVELPSNTSVAVRGKRYNFSIL